MINGYILVERSEKLCGEASLYGAKNAVLVIMASLLLSRGKSVLSNVPNSADVIQMISLLQKLGAKIFFDEASHILEIDTTQINSFELGPELMGKMRASILVMGPLLARFRKVKVALPGGCLIGSRPINFHVKGFKRMGAKVENQGNFLEASCDGPQEKDYRIVLDYPSVGATENLMMFAASNSGKTTIINAALEPEVFDLIQVLKKMGVEVWTEAPATLNIRGAKFLKPVMHEIVSDRLEAGSILLATAITGGDVYLPQARAQDKDIFLNKLEEMGHKVEIGNGGIGVRLKAVPFTKAINFRTGVYPGFPTDLQAPMMVAQCFASGKSLIEETVFESRMMHVQELRKMGAQISIYNYGSKASVRGVGTLYGAEVIASDIRASCALVLAGLAAEGKTKVFGMHHWKRGYDGLEKKLASIGAKISFVAHHQDEDEKKMVSRPKQVTAANL